MKVLNKYYRNLRKRYINMSIEDFNELYRLYIRLSKEYKILKIVNKLKSINIKYFNFPIFKFCGLFLDFVRWKIVDFLMLLINGKDFNLYGVTIFCGRQGGGKTMSMCEYLERIKKRYNDCLIVTNFGYLKQDIPLVDWRQLLDIRSENGVVFAIDEIQNEFDNSKWQDFPDGLLAVITQQRKQKVKILLTSQVYTRVVKQIREQCYEVVECKTFGGRWTREKCFDADDYNAIVDNPTPEKKFKMMKKWKYSFIQSDYLRNLYNSYAVIDRLKKSDFVKKESFR